MINTIYVFEKAQSDADSLFLAGPTYRLSSHPVSWRFEAIAILEKLGYSGNVYVPEWRNGIEPVDWTYSRQLDWEDEKLNKAKVILFWIPREMNLLPGLTTNVEFGEWMKSGKIVVGAPEGAEHVRYIHEKCLRYEIMWATTLDICVKNALDKLKEV